MNHSFHSKFSLRFAFAGLRLIHTPHSSLVPGDTPVAPGSAQSTRRVTLRDTCAIATRPEALAAVKLLIFPFTAKGLKAAGIQIVQTDGPKVPTAVVGKNVWLRTPKGHDGMAVIIASHVEASVSGSTLQSVLCKKMTTLLKTAPIAKSDGNG